MHCNNQNLSRIPTKQNMPLQRAPISISFTKLNRTPLYIHPNRLDLQEEPHPNEPYDENLSGTTSTHSCILINSKAEAMTTDRPIPDLPASVPYPANPINQSHSPHHERAPMTGPNLPINRAGCSQSTLSDCNTSHSQNSSRSISRSSCRTRSRSKSRGRDRERSKSRSKSRDRDRERSKSRFRDRGRERERSKSRSKSRSRDRETSKLRSRSPRRKRHRRSKRDGSREPKRDYSSREHKRDYSRRRTSHSRRRRGSRERSIDHKRQTSSNHGNSSHHMIGRHRDIDREREKTHTHKRVRSSKHTEREREEESKRGQSDLEPMNDNIKESDKIKEVEHSNMETQSLGVDLDGLPSTIDRLQAELTRVNSLLAADKRELLELRLKLELGNVMGQGSSGADDVIDLI